MGIVHLGAMRQQDVQALLSGTFQDVGSSLRLPHKQWDTTLLRSTSSLALCVLRVGIKARRGRPSVSCALLGPSMMAPPPSELAPARLVLSGPSTQ